LLLLIKKLRVYLLALLMLRKNAASWRKLWQM